MSRHKVIDHRERVKRLSLIMAAAMSQVDGYAAVTHEDEWYVVSLAIRDPSGGLYIGTPHTIHEDEPELEKMAELSYSRSMEWYHAFICERQLKEIA